jgi:hypothetical protein
VHSAGTPAFFPVAAHFKLFHTVGKSDKALSSREALAAYNTTVAIAVTSTGPGMDLQVQTAMDHADDLSNARVTSFPYVSRR